MPARLVEKNASNFEVRVLDEMSDGQWHPITKITKKCAEKKVLNSAQIKSIVSDLVDRGYIIAGENNSFRLPEKYVRQWRNSRDLSMETTNSHSPRFFGGILEDDGWVTAPLTEYELLNFRANSHITSQLVKNQIGSLGEISQVEDGLFRVLSKRGDEVYQILKDWNRDDPQVKIAGLRLTYNTFRRDVNQLPADFMNDLCKFYGRFAYVLLRNNMSSIKKHLPENDDIQQQIYIWIIDAVARYDDSTCIPFAAYLHSCLQRWVHNLSRKSYGRAAADNELKHARAIADFEAEHGRKPSLGELADILEEPLDKVSKDSISIKMVSNLRSMTTLDSDDFTVPLVSKENANGDVEERLESTLLSAALITAALEQETSSRGYSHVALMSIIDKHWNQDKRLSKVYRGKRSSDLLQHENNLLVAVREKIHENYSG